MWRTGSGSSYIGERMQRLRQEHQWVDFALGVADYVRPARKPDGTPPTGGDTASARRSKRLPGTVDKSALPEDVPVHPKPVHEAYSIGGGHVTAFQRVAGRAAPVLAYFRSAMPKRGWKLMSQQDAGETTILIWGKTDRSCKVELVEAERETEVWLRCQPSKRTDTGAVRR